MPTAAVHIMKLLSITEQQGLINWSRVRDADAAIIRFSQGSDSDCCIGIAPEISDLAETNMQGCFQASISCGVSHMLGGITVSEVRSECTWLIRVLRRVSAFHTLPLVVLCLGEHGISEKYRSCSPSHNASLIKTAAKILSRAGYTPVLYADRETLERCLDRKKLGKIGLWYHRPYVTERTARAEEPDMLFWHYSVETSPRNSGISADYPVSKTENYRFEPMQPRIRCHTVGNCASAQSESQIPISAAIGW